MTATTTRGSGARVPACAPDMGARSPATSMAPRLNRRTFLLRIVGLSIPRRFVDSGRSPAPNARNRPQRDVRPIRPELLVLEAAGLDDPLQEAPGSFVLGL